MPGEQLFRARSAVTDDSLVAVSLTQLLNLEQVTLPAPPAGATLPITPDGTMAANQFYADQTSTSRQWYLPTYGLNVADGRYTTSLKWRGPADDPNGPLAYLSVQLGAGVPAGGGADVAEIAHTAVVRLAYELPVEGAEGAGGATLNFEIGALNTDPNGVRSCRVPVLTKPDFDRLYAAMTTPAMHARLEIHCAATMGQQVTHRTWNVETPPIIEEPQPWLRSVPQFNVPVQQFVIPEPPPEDNLLQVARQPARIATELVAAQPEQFTVAPEIFQTVAIPTENLQFSVAQPLMFAAAPLRTATFEAKSPMVREFNHLAFRAVDDDTQVAWLRDRRLRDRIDPEILDPGDGVQAGHQWWRRRHGWGTTTTETVQVAVETVQTVDFSFAVQTNAYIFDIPDDLRPGTHEILIPHAVLIDGQSVTFYEDSSYTGRFYFAPQEMRLTRDDEPPHLPKLLFTFAVQNGTAPADGAAPAPEPDYLVQVAFAASPWISPLALEQMRQQVAATGPTEFVPLAPISAVLTMSLPGVDGGPVAPTPQPGASISLDRGVTNQLTLTPEQFKDVITALTTAGLDGVVSTTLIGSAAKDIPLSLSFARTNGHLFSRQMSATGEPGGYRVRLTNDLESPLTVHSSQTVVLSPGVTAVPDPITATVVPAQGTVELTYRVQPADAPVLDIRPDLDVTVAVDPATVLPRLMLAQGYRSDTFIVPVGVDPIYFSTPSPDGATLAGLVVEFDSGVQIPLDGTHLTAPATLRMPWLPYVLDAAEAKQYRYRITDVWTAEPAPRADPPGPWLDGAGEADLAIVPNPAAPVAPGPT